MLWALTATDRPPNEWILFDSAGLDLGLLRPAEFGLVGDCSLRPHEHLWQYFRHLEIVTCMLRERRAEGTSSATARRLRAIHDTQLAKLRLDRTATDNHSAKSSVAALDESPHGLGCCTIRRLTARWLVGVDSTTFWPAA